ncbi:MAG: hypothetical protein AAGD32_03700 [Planctomycetota bacterium]
MTLIFSLTFLLLVGVVAYFHYIQSAFSSVLSAIFAALAAVLAVGYHQTIATLGGAPLGPYGDSVAMVAIFGVSYLLLRIAFDRFVPGNLMLPVTLDRVLAVVGGLVAGIFCVGTAATAVQLLPFGPKVFFYSPYALETRSDTGEVEGVRGRITLTRFDELQADALDSSERTNILLPIDQWVVGVATHVSDGGSMAGSNNLAQVNPNLLDNAYGQRLSLQPGADIMLMVGVAGKEDASVKAVYRFTEPVPQVSGEIDVVREDELPASFTPANGKSLLVVRVGLSGDAGDSDGKLRFAPAAARFNADRGNDYAIGTFTESGVLVRNRPDDFLIAQAGGDVLLAFEVESDVFEGAENVLVDDAMVTFKRYGRLPIGGASAGAFEATATDSVLRKSDVADAISAARRGNPAPAAADDETEDEEPSGTSGAQSTDTTPGVRGLRGQIEERNEQIE